MVRSECEAGCGQKILVASALVLKKVKNGDVYRLVVCAACKDRMVGERWALDVQALDVR